MNENLCNTKCVYDNDEGLSKFLILISIYRKGIEYGEIGKKYVLGDKSLVDKDMVLDIYISPKMSSITNRKQGKIIDIRFDKGIFNYTDDELITTALDRFNGYYLD